MGYLTACGLASDICDLLTFARGTLISWVYYDLVSDSGERLFSHHVPAVTRPYSAGLPLISPGHKRTRELRFIVESLSPYRRLRTEHGSRAVVQAFAEVRGAGFMDTRALLAVSLIEYLLDRDAAAHGELTVLPDDVFVGGIDQLRKGIREASRKAYPGAGAKQIKELVAGRARGFNWTALGRRLIRTAKRLSVPLTAAEVEAFLRTRSDLVHRLQFSTSDKLQEFLLLLSILDRLVLGLLHYDGKHFDVRSLGTYVKSPHHDA